MPPSDLSAGMTAPDGDFAAHHHICMLDLDEGTDGILVGTRLFDLNFNPVASSGAGVAP